MLLMQSFFLGDHFAAALMLPVLERPAFGICSAAHNAMFSSQSALFNIYEQYGVLFLSHDIMLF